jgi:hypothetical protein
MDKSSLILRTVNGDTKYVIPLAGFGGTSNLDINGAKMLNSEYVVDMGSVSLGQKRSVNLVLRNSGLRASFVVLKCFTGRWKYILALIAPALNEFCAYPVSNIAEKPV